MYKKIKSFIFLVVIFTVMLGFIPQANAVTLNNLGQCYYFRYSDGKISSSKLSNSELDCKKTLSGSDDVNGKSAYCIQWGKEIRVGASYQKKKGWSKSSEAAIIAGIIIDKIYDDNKNSSLEAYGLTSATLNRFVRTYKNSNGKKLNYGSNSYKLSDVKKLQEYIKEATNLYNKYKENDEFSKKIPEPTINGKKPIEYRDVNFEFVDKKGTVNDFYRSNKITINFTTKYVKTVNYTITSQTNGLQICDENGNNCEKSIKFSGEESKTITLKAKASDLKKGDEVKVKIYGENKSTYPSTYIYVPTLTSWSQHLIVKTEYPVTRETNAYIRAEIPETNKYKITVHKVDENGEELSGAELSLYQDSYEEGTPIATNKSGEATVKYSTDITVHEENPEFFNHDYYLVETKAPNGYTLKGPIPILKKGQKVFEKSDTCFKTENEELKPADSIERCKYDKYVYVCLEKKDGQLTGNITEDVSLCPPVTQEPVQPIEDIPEGTDGTNPEGDLPDEGGEEKPNIGYERACYQKGEDGKPQTRIEDESYCNEEEKTKYTLIHTENGNVTVTVPNDRNQVSISKKAITGDDEIEGAELKICTKENYDKSKAECEAAKTLKTNMNDEEVMEWISTSSPQTFYAVPAGNYYIIETVAPAGYIKATTATEFSVNEKGEVIQAEKVINDQNPIVINNQINSLSISKQDIATSKELPGATLSICTTYLDENNNIQLEKDKNTGDCIPAVLANGEDATWTSTNKPHMIEGLPAGTYYLVENIAPTNYSTAESILFKMTEDGKILDINDKEIFGNNKIVMQDKLIKEVKTGDLPILGIIIICLTCLGTASICYYYSNKKYGTI